jgi:NADH-ubiquinone oxidoreductase chain 1
MTEHAAVIFVFFFLAEYASIVLICILISTLFIGGYLFDFLTIFIKLKDFLINSVDLINSISLFLVEGIPYKFLFENINNYEELNSVNLNLEGYLDILSYYSLDGILYSLSLGFKTCLMIFIFI